MTIALDHVELTSADNLSAIPDERTLLRYWQARVPGTDLYAVTEEGFTRTEPGQYVHMTRFIVCATPATQHGPAGDRVIEDDTYEYGQGAIAPALRALTEPHTWDDAPRQRMLAEAIERVTQDA